MTHPEEKNKPQIDKEITPNSPAPEIQEDNQSEGRLVQFTKGYSFSGPIPPPQILSQYEQILPGAAGRILGMAEKQSNHRQNMEKRIIYSETFQGTLGMVFAFVIALVAIAGGVFLIFSGRPIEGLISLLTPLAIIVASFLNRPKKDQKQNIPPTE
ncbi:MAG: DUF2335 domain-containing protein [Candidatus Velamenicoccus archaeovorus]